MKTEQILVVFVNGCFDESLSDYQALPKSVLLKPVSALDSTRMTEGVLLQIPSNCQVTTTIRLQFITTEKNRATVSPRILILIGEHSHITVLEEYISQGGEEYHTAPVTEIRAAENAKITYYKLQDESMSASHIANLFIEQQKESQVTTFLMDCGARQSQEDIRVHLGAEGVVCQLHGLYYLTHSTQQSNHEVTVEHVAAHSTSSMLYKGMLDNKTQASFKGKVFVHALAKHIQAHQANHNLLLSNEAAVSSKPELEIYADDVKCTHGATVGQLDQEALFYLRSRGLDEISANQLLRQAFVAELIDKMPHNDIKQWIRQRVMPYEFV